MHPPRNTLAEHYQKRGDLGNDGQRAETSPPSSNFPAQVQRRPPVGSRSVTQAAGSAMPTGLAAIEAQKRGQVGRRPGNDE